MPSPTTDRAPTPSDRTRTAQTLKILNFNTAGTVGTVTLVNAATGEFRYVPPTPFYNGTTTFTYEAQDNGQSWNGTAMVNDFKSDTATVTITVTEVNDVPIANDYLWIIQANPTPGQEFTLDGSTGGKLMTAGRQQPGPDGATDEVSQTLTVVGVNGRPRRAR